MYPKTLIFSIGLFVVFVIVIWLLIISFECIVSPSFNVLLPIEDLVFNIKPFAYIIVPFSFFGSTLFKMAFSVEFTINNPCAAVAVLHTIVRSS